jgi:hypothetical protein
LSLLFVVHRLLTFPFLSDISNPFMIAKAFLVGTWSDLWIAWLAAFAVFIVHVVASPTIARRVDRFALILMGVVLAGHQSYVEFFGFQFILNHFKYLADRAFIGANIRSLLEWRVLATGLFALALAIACSRVRLPALKTKIFPVAAALGIALLPILAHALNIHYRVQWFVPESLQANLAERMYLQWKIQDNLTRYPETELAYLREHWPHPVPFREFKDLLWRPVAHASGVLPVAVQMRRQFDDARRLGRKPIVMVLLLESARPLEFGAFGLYPGPSLTPQFDTLMKDSILFKEAYSTGTVTRSGQEASWCGYFSSFSNSLMRERPDLNLPCLPALLGTAATSFWFHGGKGEFDNQRAFWKKQGIERFLTDESFSFDSPRTDWGVSDRRVFRRSVEDVERFKKDPATADYLVGMILSVTNHIPWRVPSDSSDDVKAAAAAGAPPHFVTTMYTDHALGEFVGDLKSRGLWDDTLLIISSDHGITKEARANYNGADAAKKQLSHIVLAVSGGIVNRSLGSSEANGMTVEDVVSQADIAPFIALVTGNDNPSFLGEPLLSKRQMPVFSDVITDVYFPRQRASISRKDKIEMPLQEVPENLKFPVSYYRSFLYSLSELTAE